MHETSETILYSESECEFKIFRQQRLRLKTLVSGRTTTLNMNVKKSTDTAKIAAKSLGPNPTVVSPKKATMKRVKRRLLFKSPGT